MIYELISENKLISSLALILICYLVRMGLIAALRRTSQDEDDNSKRWINSVKNFSSLIIAVGLIIIWLSELRHFALSIAAFVVALVIALREFIQCIMGSFYQATTRAFSVGDWVRIGPFYGEVARSDWLSTTLLEVDIEKGTYDYTGKTLTIPNHLLVTHTVQNLNFMRRYVLHSFAIVRDAENINLFEARQFILAKVEEYCAPFQEVAKRYAHIIEKRMGLHLSTLKPSVRITTSDIGKNVFTVALFCPTQEAVNIEQMIYADFMSYWYKHANEASKD